MKIVLTANARRDMKNLPKQIAIRIEEKLYWFSDQSDPLQFAEPLHGMKQKLYRFRIGDYRAIFTLEKGQYTLMFVYAVRHRREAY